ncbi:hypothetical protein BC739_003103 [Kutzneria viridogrisea]|uniref:Lsr2 dimerization domain-containing protein n=1 Tax=Kutzneria viridogrisea TaxID=47990 RepID=A0ABR6BG87_9PSEU|nr:hypothetical protein [Kutzneria viridogrisea]
MDDIDRESDATRTISFGLGNRSYVIDVNDAHAEQLENEFGAWIKFARQEGKARPSIPRRPGPPTVVRGDWWETPPDATPEEKRKYKNLRAQIKTWGKTRGWPADLGQRGRVPRALCERWLDEVCDGKVPDIGAVTSRGVAVGDDDE